MNVYFQVAKLINTVKESGNSFKEVFYGNNYCLSQFCKKIYSLGLNTLKHEKELEKLSELILNSCSVKSKYLLFVIIFDYFTAPSKPRVKGALMKTVAKFEDKLSELIASKGYLKVTKPKRKITFHNFSSSADDFPKNSVVSTLREVDEMTDDIVEMANKGDILVQSLSSSLPVHFLKANYGHRLPKTFKCVDACSAPGNKTIQMANYFKKANIVAVEKNGKRFESLKKRVKQFGLNNRIKLVNQDVLETTQEQLKNPRVVLLDPSCSGSGMKGFKEEPDCGCSAPSGSGLEQYTSLQFDLLSKFMQFESTNVIVYSTCSIYKEENEQMVKKILKAYPEWTLGTLKGGESFTQGEGIPEAIRVCPRCHATDGFFLCIFERNLD